ncbi:MAG: hypothetical protein P8X90_17555 [Desulfobacterales bacterium]
MNITQLHEALSKHLHNLTETQISMLLFLAAIVISLVCYTLVTFILKRWHARKAVSEKGMQPHIKYFKAPLRALIPAIFLLIVLPFLKLPIKALQVSHHALIIWLIIAVAWLSIKVVRFGRDLILSRYHIDARDKPWETSSPAFRSPSPSRSAWMTW